MHADAQTEMPANNTTALPMQAHTILGVCEAIGEDFGFNPMWLRGPFAASVLISPTYAIVGYLALGVVVLATRLLFPKTKAQNVDVIGQAAPVPANNQVEERLAA